MSTERIHSLVDHFNDTKPWKSDIKWKKLDKHYLCFSTQSHTLTNGHTCSLISPEWGFHFREKWTFSRTTVAYWFSVLKAGDLSSAETWNRRGWAAWHSKYQHLWCTMGPQIPVTLRDTNVPLFCAVWGIMGRLNNKNNCFLCSFKPLKNPNESSYAPRQSVMLYEDEQTFPITSFYCFVTLFQSKSYF